MVENASEILVPKWRIFYRPIIAIKADTITLIVKITCILHNFLRTKKYDDEFIRLLNPAEPELIQGEQENFRRENLMKIFSTINMLHIC